MKKPTTQNNSLMVRAKKTAETFLTTGNSLAKQVKDLTIAKRDDLQIATSIMKQCQFTEQELEAKRLEITKPLNDFITDVNILFKETAMPILSAKSGIKQKILVWNQEQERIKLEEEQKRFAAEQERLKKIEEERLAREKIEQKKREKEEARLKAIADKQGLEQQKIEQEKLEIERKNREIEEEKTRIAEEKMEMTRKFVADNLAAINARDNKVKGVARLWTYEIIEESKVPRAFCTPDSKKINEAIKSGIREIDGLRIFENKIVR